MADKDKKADIFTLPEGRVIYEHLFVKNQYNDNAVPQYSVDVAIPKDSEALADLEDKLLDFADDYWGAGAGDDKDLVIPLLDGDNLARKREKKGKEGDAYKGMVVIKANTLYNKDGTDGPGGVQVYDPDVEVIEPARQGEVYPGCYGEAAVTIGAYENNDGNNALKFYLSAFQKTRDGEKLVSSADRSGLFKPVGRTGGGEKGSRRRRSR